MATSHIRLISHTHNSIHGAPCAKKLWFQWARTPRHARRAVGRDERGAGPPRRSKLLTPRPPKCSAVIQNSINIRGHTWYGTTVATRGSTRSPRTANRFYCAVVLAARSPKRSAALTNVRRPAPVTFSYVSPPRHALQHAALQLLPTPQLPGGAVDAQKRTCVVVAQTRGQG